MASAPTRKCASGCAALDGVDLFAWLELDGAPFLRGDADGPPPANAAAVVERDGALLRFRPGTEVSDRRGAGWDVDGDLEALAGAVADGRFDSATYPDALARLHAALVAPHAGEILISAEVGYELVDWGGTTHCPGGSHGALEAGDSLGPLLLCGLEPGIESLREQWAISDVAGLVRGHFGLDQGGDALRVSRAEPSRVSG